MAKSSSAPQMKCLYYLPPTDDERAANFSNFAAKKKKGGIFSMMSCLKSSRRSRAPEAMNYYGGVDSGRPGRSASSAAEPPQPHNDPLLQLVSLQNASGSWMLHEALAAVLGKTKEEVEKAKPELVNNEVWASILALIWLHGFKMDAQEEWELLAMKAASWIKAQNAPCVSECVEAGNKLLRCSMKKEALGL